MYSIRNTGSALIALVGSTVVPDTDLMVFSPCQTFSSRIVGTRANPNLGRPAAKLSTSTRVNGEHGSEAFERGENRVRVRLVLELEDPMTVRDASAALVRLVDGAGETDKKRRMAYILPRNLMIIIHAVLVIVVSLNFSYSFIRSLSGWFPTAFIPCCFCSHFLTRRSIRPSPHRPSLTILTYFYGYKPNQEPCVIHSLSASSPTSLLPFSSPAT